MNIEHKAGGTESVEWLTYTQAVKGKDGLYQVQDSLGGHGTADPDDLAILDCKRLVVIRTRSVLHDAELRGSRGEDYKHLRFRRAPKGYTHTATFTQDD